MAALTYFSVSSAKSKVASGTLFLKVAELLHRLHSHMMTNQNQVLHWVIPPSTSHQILSGYPL